MAQAINRAIEALEKKDSVVIPIEPDVNGNESFPSSVLDTSDSSMLSIYSSLTFVSLGYLLLSIKKKRRNLPSR